MTTHTASEKFLEIKGVRITPSKLELDNTFHLDEVSGKFIIQNVGKYMVFIRIFPASIQDCYIESIKDGKSLPVGLRITRTVKFTSSGCSGSVCTVPIYINDHRCDYQITLNCTRNSLTIMPMAMNLGTLQVGLINRTPGIYIQNNGLQQASFHVDVAKSDVVVIAEPRKGSLMGLSSMDVAVKIISLYETAFSTTISIKSADMVCVIPITGNMIFSKLEAIHINTTEFFTLINFPPTYFGLKSVQNLYVRNRCIMQKMFSSAEEVSPDNINKSDFDSFRIQPADGYFEPDETKLFQFTFTPIRKPGYKTSKDDFYFATILIHKFRCKTLHIRGPSLSQFFEIEKEISSLYERRDTLTTYHSSTTNFEEDAGLEQEDAELYYNCVNIAQNEFIRVHLYATAEYPTVEVIPDMLVIHNMNINTKETRVLELRNKSTNLPIIFHYKKIAFITLKKTDIYLNPMESVQISVDICPQKLGLLRSKIVFELMYYDQPKTDVTQILSVVVIPITIDVVAISNHPKPQLNLGLTPNYIKDVGKSCQDVKFNTVLPKAKIITVYNTTVIDDDCSDLVAFPNDTQQSIKPWRSAQKCRTIFTKMPRYRPIVDYDYEETAFDSLFRKNITDYYTQFIRKAYYARMSTINKVNSEYSLTKYKKVMCRDKNYTAHIRCSPVRTLPASRAYIPLTPKQMEKIVVTPSLIDTGQVAANDIFPIKIAVTNGNPFPVRIFIKVDKMTVLLDKNRCVLKENQSHTVNLGYQSAIRGYHTSVIELIVNESMVLSVPVLAEVVPKMLHVSANQLEFDDENPLRYIDVINKLGVPIEFHWIVSSSNFIVKPEYGKVSSNCCITCSFRFNYNISGSVENHIILYSGDDIKISVKLTVKTKPKNIILPDPGVIFENLPLNKTTLRKIKIRNPHNLQLAFRIDENQFEQNITIYPLRGVLPPMCEFAIYLTAKFTNCVRFDGFAVIEIPCGRAKLRIFGNVVYPNIEVHPTILNIPKVPASSSSDLKFMIKNHGVASTSVSFDMAEFPDFKITKSINLTNDSNLDEIIIDSMHSKQLYIHFIPSFESSCVFYLPMIINEILGPPLYTDMVSTTVNYYLTDDIDNVEYIPMPKYLPCIKVRSLAMPPKILLSKTRIIFNTNPKNRYGEQEVYISNPQGLREEVGIQMEEVAHPFYVDCSECNGIVQKSDRGIVFFLDPDESMSLKIYFKPHKSEFGTHKLVLRIILRSDMSQEPHTAICVKANYDRSEISQILDSNDERYQQFHVNSECIRYARIFPPVNIPIIFSRQVICKNHLPGCKINIEHSLDGLDFRIFHEIKQYIDEDTYSYPLKIYWIPAAEKTFCLPWKVCCTCGGLWEQYAHLCVERSFLTTPVFCQTHFHCITSGSKKEIMVTENKKSPEFFSSYPFYPMYNTPEAHFLDTCITVLEKWVYTQLSYGEGYHQIPNTINNVEFLPVTEEQIKRQTRSTACHLADILITLAGSRVRKILELKDERDIPDDNLGRAEYLMGVYTRAIDFLKVNGASITYIQPEFLIPFTLYMDYRKEMYEDTGPPYTLTKYITGIHEFHGIAKNSWMDIMLQIFKVFVVNRIYNNYKAKRFDINIIQQNNPISTFHEAYDLNNKDLMFLSDGESYLLNWLEYTYNTNRYTVWKRQLAEKRVILFDDSMKDGIILATVTLVYCPYLMPYFKSLYFQNCSTEETMHNASTIARAWKMVNFSFDVDADLICNPHAMVILILTAYLYEMLPYMYPSETLSFNVGLSKTTKDSIQIRNSNEFPIAYKPILITENECFSIQCTDIIVIHPKKIGKITITYFAKFAKQAHATLLLSGETKGYRYAKNKCIALIGNPNLSAASTTIKLSVFLYNVVDVSFLIKSPYKTSAAYDLQYTNKMLANDPEQLSKVVFHHQKDRLSCSRLMLFKKKFEFNEDGVSKLEGFLVTFGNFDSTIWMYFRNKEVGDFCVKIITKMNDCLEREVLTVVLSEDRQKRTSAHKIKTIFLEIPYRNRLLMKAARSLLIRRTEGAERALWERILDTAMGINVLQRLLMLDLPNTGIPNVFHCISGEYQITTSNSGGVLFPDTVTFPEECSSAYLKVPLQLINPSAIPAQVELTLESKKMFRKRIYIVRFENALSLYDE